MIWFTSDQHFWHANVIVYCKRPYSSVEEMNEDLILKFNQKVSPGDIVYHLGDFSMAHRPVEAYLPRLMGEHHLIAGNHDHVHPVHHKNRKGRAERMRELYTAAGFKTIQLESEIEIAGQMVKLHHMPYAGDHTEGERYTQWRPKDSGGWLLHGHIHEKWKQRGRMLNVGVDVWDYAPVSIDEVAAIILAPQTTCKDCGVDTVAGSGSARCPSCWDDRCGPK